MRQLKQNYERYKTKSLQENFVELQNMPNIDEEKIKEYVENLKDAIICVQKMRDSLAHANKNLHIDSILTIDNAKNKFEIAIPIEYLDGFNKGRIIANEEDKVLIEKTNNMSSPLLEALDFDIKKIDSFFYNVDPVYLDFILEKVNYDSQKIYKLSTDIFTYKYETKIILDMGLDIFEISKLPHNAFEYLENTVWLKEKTIDITKLQNFSFKFPEETLILLENNVDISKLPESAFLFCEATMTLLKRNIDITKLSENAFRALHVNKKVLKLFEEDIDVYKLSETAFDYPEETIKMFKEGIDVYKLAGKAFKSADVTIKLLRNNIDAYQLPWSVFEYPEETIKLFKCNINIYQLPYTAFKSPEATIMLFNQGIDIYKLPQIAFEYPKETLKLFKENIDVYKLQRYAFTNPQKTIELFKENIDIYNAPMSAFYNCEKTIKLFKANIDITKIPAAAFKYTNLTIKLFEANIDIYKIPQNAFQYPEKIKLLYQLNIDITKLPDEALQYINLTIRLFEENINIYKLPSKCFSSNINISNLKKILEKVDYEQLDMLPIEFFECDTLLLDEMFQKYNLNISKSIFGINNPKIIALIIYANRVLSEYNQSINNIDIQMNSIIEKTCNECFKYQKTIEENTGKKFTSQDFVNQFQLTDENNILRSEEEIKKTFFTKVRNASQHFRFKQVKDNKGQVLEDKIYLYDEDNKGRNNFNLIIDINDLINIIRNIEEQMTKKETITSIKKR